jgi:FkbM family methyltransferase
LRKTVSDDFEGRFREIMADPSNEAIPRVPSAGMVAGGFVTMHNGLEVAVGEYAYYGEFARILELNRGVHEPQEERVFMEVLRHIPAGGTMIELGSYWAFYSMWFLTAVPGSRVFCVEPEEHNLAAGRINFERNGLRGDFTQAAVGNEGLRVDDFVIEKDIDFVDILHADVQGAEIEMLRGAQETIAAGRIGYWFIGTHSQQLHLECRQFLEARGYAIIASADVDNETFAFDGVLVARLAGLEGPGPFDLGSRAAEVDRMARVPYHHPVPFVSHAQNCEDVLLWRALRDVPDGFYIDVGASDPDDISVTKAFYDAGWHGINVEPVPAGHASFVEKRPRDVNLAVAAGTHEGVLTLFDLPDRRGYSTSDERLAAGYRAQGLEVEVLEVPMTTLAKICEEHVAGEVHFLKIDVEGAEADVLGGMDLSRWRPWILVIEATLPNTQTESHEDWEAELLARDYQYAHFDGLNRYYVAREHAELVRVLAVQPNVFDRFITWEQERAEKQLAEERAARLEAETQVARLSAEAAALTRQLDEVHASTSWRVSSPVRVAGRQVERLSRSARSGRARREAGKLARRFAPGLVAWRARKRSAPRRVESPADPLLMAAEAASLTHRPLISILLPVYDTPPQYLRLAVDSVLAQAYPEWELCVCDDGSGRAETLAVLEGMERRDPRIRVVRLESNAGIAGATNAGLAMARGDYVAMLDHDDEIAPGALLEVVKVLQADPAVDVVYTDQDSITANGALAETFRKPDWSLEMFRGVMYVGHLLVVRTTLARTAGGFDPAFDNVQDFEFMLRVAERTDRIAHVPKVLYHWRMIPGSVATHADVKKDIEPRQAAAVNAHFERCEVPAEARSNPGVAHRLLISPRPRADWPRVSVVVRAAGVEADLEACLARILSAGSYPGREVIVAGGDVPESVARRLEEHGVVVVAVGARGGAAARAGFERATGRLIVSMIGDLEVETPDWLEHLLFNCELPGVGCVTPVVLAPDGRVSSAGLHLTADGGVGPAMRGRRPGSDGYAGSLACVREVTAVSGSCLAVTREALDQLGGLNEYYSTDYCQAVDLSIRAVAEGHRNLCTPRVTVRHRAQAASEGEAVRLDRLLLLDAWEPLITRGDVYWHGDAPDDVGARA